MKKLIVAAIAVSIAFASQAATIKWSYSTTDSKFAGSTFYLIAATSLPTASQFANADDISSWTDSALTYLDTVSSKGKYANAKTYTADNITKDKSYYLLIASSDEKSVQVSQLISGASAVYDPGAQETQITTTITPNGTWMPVGVPEPTSAMLLLLGVAGLALRRRA